ncbi:Gpi1-domain-containing protein [Conidiobolus coronatus NRRL 28638]|uniref:Gpi1-domain-containing protein n=1 Tax=Conidiobolus coronatus (strain ATCC 28846 / CBS 209.66 / NRRL 28638) TaxID=796925 RepID=A0A137P5B3_CONC2|nr:Gpi1-domain-containing protein [Conidiobolus coronatus NRRL 28638]|eukprot:KXN70111.1 Gpi1-domain-containing protein [Conidiobolus coronatus NRRL 28638]
MQRGEWAYDKSPCLTLFKVDNLINQFKTRYNQIDYILKGYQLEPNSYCYSTQFKYWSTIYIVLFDILSGSIVGYYLNHNKEYAERFIVKVIRDYTLKLPQKIVSWLKEYPVGLKLNSKLAYFLSRLFSWSIINWNSLLLTTLKPHCPDLIGLIGFFGFIGLSFCLSLSCDILSVSLLHTHWFYLVARKIFYWHQAVLISLYYLFLGKKWNPLRQRVDLGDYRSGHIIIGSILFTFLIFLFPSILIYYTTFTLGWVLIYCSQGVFIFFINCLNLLPVWGYLARFYHPQKFYTGIKLKYTINLLDLYYTRCSIESNYGKYYYFNQDLVNNLSYLKSNYFSVALIKKYIRGDLIFKK